MHEDDDDDSDFMLRRDFTVRQGSRLRREFEPESNEHPQHAMGAHPESAGDDHPAVGQWPKRRPRAEPTVADWPLRRSARRRSVTRRVAERLVLGIVALGVATAIWIAPEFQDATNTVSMQTNARPQLPAGMDTTALRSTEPAWLSPETLYATSIAPSPSRRSEAPSFLLRPGR